VTGSVDDLVSRGRAALRVGDAATARDVLAPGDPSAPDILEARARAAYLDLQFRTAIDLWQAAYAAYRAAADNVAAVRVARTLGNTHGAILGDWAVANGWLARAQTLLGGDQESAEAGWVALSRGMFEPDRTRKDRLFRLALAAGRRHGDNDLQFVALAYLGASLVHDDRTEEGMVLLDEALAAVAGDEVDDATSVEEVFCQLFSACEHAHDVTRADQWIAVGQAVAERRRLPAVSAFCRTHYGGILTTAGRWDEADAALSEAVRLWGLGWRSLRSGALVRLADLRVRQGRFEEAEQLLADPAVVADHASARPRAALHLARGRLAAARDVANHALAGTGSDSAAAAPLLSLLVDVHLAAGDLAEAARAVGENAKNTIAIAQAMICRDRKSGADDDLVIHGDAGALGLDIV
jgi:tetratricopeptide (TPR) repeat protein